MRMMARARACFLGCCVAGLGLAAVGSPAAAQWTRVTELPATKIFSLWAMGDTIVAGLDSVVYVSTNAGGSWRASTKPTPGVSAITALWVLDRRVYAGTLGQGVFVSDDLGSTWQAYNQGLVGGLLDSQLFMNDFQVLDHHLIAATSGAGVYVRNLAGGGWSPFGGAFESNQASNVNGLAVGGTRLLASAGGNGAVFVRDPGDPDWDLSNLDNVGIRSGVMADAAAWTGFAWVVGTNVGVFRSAFGVEPWVAAGPGLGVMNWVAFTTQGRRLFAAFDVPNAAVIQESGDEGETWENTEVLTSVFVQKMVIVGSTLYAARQDGLWRRPSGVASVDGGVPPRALAFSIAGPQPFADQARLRFDLAEPGVASIQMFDIQGRTSGERTEAWWSSGQHEVTIEGRNLRPGVYTALLRSGDRRETLKLIHVR